MVKTTSYRFANRGSDLSPIKSILYGLIQNCVTSRYRIIIGIIDLFPCVSLGYIAIVWIQFDAVAVIRYNDFKLDLNSKINSSNVLLSWNESVLNTSFLGLKIVQRKK